MSAYRPGDPQILPRVKDNGYVFAGKEWTTRTKRIAAAIPPGCTVIDLGGGEENLRKYLRKPTWYASVDKKMCTPDTTLADFNKGEFPDILAADYIVAQGVVEYLDDPGAFFKTIRKYGSMLIFTWVEPGKKTAEKRTAFNIVDVLEMATAGGWEVLFTRRAPEGQVILYCTKI